jgi:hypothetical protein
MGRMSVAGLAVVVTIANPHSGTGHALAETAFRQEILLKPADLPVEQIVGLVNQANCDVGDDGSGSGLNELPKSFKSHVRLVSQASGVSCFFGVFIPNR